MNAKRLICSVENENVDISISQDIKNFDNTTIKLEELNNKSLKCHQLVLYNKLSNKIKFLKVDHLNSKFSYENFIKKF